METQHPRRTELPCGPSLSPKQPGVERQCLDHLVEARPTIAGSLLPPGLSRLRRLTTRSGSPGGSKLTSARQIYPYRPELEIPPAQERSFNQIQTNGRHRRTTYAGIILHPGEYAFKTLAVMYDYGTPHTSNRDRIETSEVQAQPGQEDGSLVSSWTPYFYHRRLTKLWWPTPRFGIIRREHTYGLEAS